MALLNNRLSLAIRFLTLIEFQVRRALDQNHEHPDGLFLENPKKTTTGPTSERLSRAFSKTTLTIVTFHDHVQRRVTSK